MSNTVLRGKHYKDDDGCRLPPYLSVRTLGDVSMTFCSSRTPPPLFLVLACHCWDKIPELINFRRGKGWFGLMASKASVDGCVCTIFLIAD